MPPLFVTALLIVIAALLAASIKRIPEGTVYTLRRFDGHARVLNPGVHWVLPLAERVVHRIVLTGQTLPIDERVALDDAAQPLALRGTVYWQVLDPKRADAVIERADDLIRLRAMNALRAVDAPQSESVEARNLRMKQALNDTLRERGVLVTRVQLSLG